MPVVHPGRGLEGERPLLQDRAGAGPVQGPRRARHGPRDDPRGGRRDPPARHRPELPPAADDRLPLPDEVPRRAALPWRPHPRPRVRDEGLVLAATSTTPGLDVSYRKHYARLRADLRAPRARRDRRRRPTSGSWAAPAPTSSWSSTSSARTPSSCATTAASPTTSRSRSSASPTRSPRTLLPMEDVETPGRDDDRCARDLPRHPEVEDRQGRVLRDRRRPLRRRHRPRRLRRQRDEARQHRSRPAAASGRRRVEEIKARGMEAGYGSPLGARDAVVVVDELVARSPNLVAGANRVGWHVRNVNVPRDYTPDHVAEITNAREGDPCPNCGSPVKLRKGIEVGNIFKLGTDFTERVRVDVPRRGRRAPPDRHGLVRHRARAERRVHRRGPPRREGHRLAGRGRAVRRAPGLDRRGPRPERRSRPPSGSTRSRRTPAARSSTTTATSRRA